MNRKSLNHFYNVQDEYYTPKILVTPLLAILEEYFKKLSSTVGKESKKQIKNRLIYCPFDTQYSEYVIVLKEAGYRVIYGDISTGQDFFKLPIPKEVDIVISNPPFSRKKKVFEKCFAAQKPFILLMNMMSINYDEINNLFRTIQDKGQEPVQFLIPDKKVSFNGNTSSFNSGYITWNILKHTQFFHLEHHNAGKDFTPATRYTIKERDKKRDIDYNNLYEILKTREMTTNEIAEFIGTHSPGSVAQCITTLSLKYPIYSLKHGIYKVMQ